MKIASRLNRGFVATALIAAASLVVLDASPADAKGEPKKPKCGTKKNPCNGEMRDDELFYAGYWLARKGDFKLALHYLNQAENKDDARILTYIGYSTRKLGRTEEAMGYYARALALKPDYAVARAYLGEALLQSGERAKAAEQLALIEKQCGTSCIEYKELSVAMAKSQRS